MSPTQLRKNLYQTLDWIIETGKPVKILRGETELVIKISKKKKSKLDNIVPQDYYVADMDEINEMDLNEWEPKL